MSYYKVISAPKKVGTIVDTNEHIDYARIKRMSTLNKLFNLLYDLSLENDLPFQNILSLIYPNFNSESNFEIDENIKTKIEKIKSEISVTHFIIQNEFRFFNDFVIDKVRHDLFNELNLTLPDRFKSHYFFESLIDCVIYCYDLNLDPRNTIMEVDFVEIFELHKMDNRLVSNFHNHYTSKHFYNQAKDFLMKNDSENPFYEIIFQGKYKIINHISLGEYLKV